MHIGLVLTLVGYVIEIFAGFVLAVDAIGISRVQKWLITVGYWHHGGFVKHWFETGEGQSHYQINETARGALIIFILIPVMQWFLIFVMSELFHVDMKDSISFLLLFYCSAIVAFYAAPKIFRGFMGAAIASLSFVHRKAEARAAGLLGFLLLFGGFVLQFAGTLLQSLK